MVVLLSDTPVPVQAILLHFICKTTMGGRTTLTKIFCRSTWGGFWNQIEDDMCFWMRWRTTPSFFFFTRVLYLNILRHYYFSHFCDPRVFVRIAGCLGLARLEAILVACRRRRDFQIKINNGGAFYGVTTTRTTFVPYSEFLTDSTDSATLACLTTE